MKRFVTACVMAPGLVLAVSAPSSASLVPALAAALAGPETLAARQPGESHASQNGHLQLAASGTNQFTWPPKVQNKASWTNKFRQPKPKFQFKPQNKPNWTNKFRQPKPQFKWPAKPQNNTNWANQFMQQKPKFQFKPRNNARTYINPGRAGWPQPRRLNRPPVPANPSRVFAPAQQQAWGKFVNRYQELNVGRVGNFTILKINDRAQFQRCAASLTTRQGMLRIAWDKNRQYSLSIPDRPVRRGWEWIYFQLDGGIRYAVQRHNSNGRRASGILKPAHVDMFLDARRDVKITYGNTVFVWPLRNIVTVFSAMEDCVNKAQRPRP